MSPLSFQDARREQNGILAEAERQALHWMAARLPGRIHSDHLTSLGLLAMLAAGAAYACSQASSVFLHVVNFCLFLNWVGDSLDGTLARYRNRLRPRYGFYVDHILDTFSMSFLFGGLALSGYMSPQVVALVLIAYFMLCINVYLATYTLGTFKISFGKFSPTELRLLLGIGNVVLFYRPTVHVLGRNYLLFDIGGVIAAALMAGILITSTARNIQVLYNAERLS
ncbi:MAG: CDP-alcohol phosphatidyltransferase family protein [Acidobacteria bacterium]|nr:CDP-alcohol phosphatidyltransferase family protein [Acidobacteriota bacterium]MCI0621239.1 CDP-alcohol phosphatidyltransferase family protein [Acidobacteriota bacterium]MCI0718109.1 CDP-alcohol phosphatidyltransferase family protein [Acidobacteriota bacterium]